MNRVTLIGNVGKDPEMKTGQSGKSFVKLTVATTEKGFTRNDGTKVEDQTEWHKVYFFGSKADVIGKYMKKGDKVMVEGKLKTSQRTDQNGQTKYFTDIMGTDFEFLNTKPRQQQTYSAPAEYGNKGQGKVDMYAATANANGSDEDAFPF